MEIDFTTTTTTTTTSINLLTDDILFKILSHLTYESDRKSFPSTCRNFYRVESLHLTHIRILRPEYISPLLSKFLQISSLDLSDCPRIYDAVAATLLPSLRRLKRLNLSRCTGLRSTGLEMLARACVFLESVDVSYCCRFGDREAAALSCAAGLREICLDKCLNVGDVGLGNIAVGCFKLERLSVKWCFGVTDVGIGLLCAKCDQLKQLDISYLKVTSECVRSISTMEKLEVLQMVGCGLVDDMGLHYLANGCPSLQEISMTFVHQLKDLKKLNILRIDGSQVSDSVLQIFSQNCGFLVEIGLGKCRGVTDNGIMWIVSGCVILKALDLTCCSELTDSSILAIANSCQNLVCLKIECCNLLTENSLYYLGSHCLLLEEIDLTDCPGVNDIGLEYLSKCSEILSLKLGLCTNISDKGLFYIASNCKNIRELDLYRCIGIGDDGLAALSRGCKKLRKLILSYCIEVSDRGIGCLGLLEELSSLELRSLNNVTGSGLRTLAAGCKRLAELDLKNCESIYDSGFCALAYCSKNLQQINFSGCKVSDMGLCTVMGYLMRIQDAKLVNIVKVTVNGLELALRASWGLKKLKLLAHFRRLISPEIINKLEAKGCKIK